MRLTPIKYNQTQYDILICKGGWDLETPSLSLPNGYVRDALNFEVSNVKGGGYRRIDGYERFDGRTAPSAATYTIVQVDSIWDTWTLGDLIGATPSLATGTYLAQGSNYFVITQPTGTFPVGNRIFDVAANVTSLIVDQTVVPSNLLQAQYQNAAADVLRALIQKVPGSGSIRGVAVLTIAGVDTVFAFRDNVGGTAGAIYKATTSGWTAVTLLNEVSFTAGTTKPAEGDTLTQGGVTATIRRVVHESGSYTGGTAAGRLIITNPAGGNFGAGAATAPGCTMTLSGIQTAITITPGGRYEFDTYNFFGQSGTKRLYGCNGVNRPFEFDGTYYVPINHNDVVRFPTHVAAHKEHLFFSTESSIIHSGPGEPYKINAAAGGGEIALGDTVTNFVKQPGDNLQGGGSLGVTTLSNVHVLYGSSSLNWSLVGLNTGVMGKAYTAGKLNDSFWLDRNGVTNLVASQNFGNFDSAMLTNNITRFIEDKVGFAVGSVVNRKKSQYRLYFSDGSALFATIVNGKLFGLMPQQLGHTFSCFWDGVSQDGNLYAGGTDGYVYHLDNGTSFDGLDIDAYLVFNWNQVRSPRVLKRYRHASLEVEGGSYAEISFGFNLSYNKPNVPQDGGRSYQLLSSGGVFWDNFTWDAFFWDGSVVAPSEVEMRGSGENVQFVIRSGTDYMSSYAINSIILHYTPRRGLR